MGGDGTRRNGMNMVKMQVCLVAMAAWQGCTKEANMRVLYGIVVDQEP